MLSEPPGADPHAGWCGRGQGKPGLYPILVALAVLLVSPAPAVATAGQITVTTLNDSTSSGDGCSLRAAIVNFNNQDQTYSDCATVNGANIINFSVTGTLKLGSELPEIRPVTAPVR